MQTDYEILKSPEIEDQGTVFEMLYESLVKCDEYLLKYLFDRVEIELFSVSFTKKRK